MTKEAGRRVDHVVFNMLLKGVGNLSETKRLLHDAVQGDEFSRYDEVTVHDRVDRRRMMARAIIVETTGIDVWFRADRITRDMKLSDDIKWKDGTLRIRNQRLPDTVIQALVGQPLTRLVAHPAFSDDMVIKSVVQNASDDIRVCVEANFIDPRMMRASLADMIEHRRRRMKDRLASISAYFKDYAEMALHREDEPRWSWGAFLLALPCMPLSIAIFGAVGLFLLTGGLLAKLAGVGAFAFLLWIVALITDCVLNNPSVSVHYMPKRCERLQRARQASGAACGICKT